MSKESDGVLAFPRSPFFERAMESGGVDRDKAIADAGAAVKKLAPQLRKDGEESRTELLHILELVAGAKHWQRDTLARARQASDTIRDIGPLCGMVFAARVARILSDILDDIALNQAVVLTDDLRRFGLALQRDDDWSASVGEAESNLLVQSLEGVSSRPAS